MPKLQLPKPDQLSENKITMPPHLSMKAIREEKYNLEKWIILMTILEKKILDLEKEENQTEKTKKKIKKYKKRYATAEKSFKKKKFFDGKYFQYFRNKNLYNYEEIVKLRIENKDTDFGGIGKYTHLLTRKLPVYEMDSLLRD